MTPFRSVTVRDTLVRKLLVNVLFVEIGFIVTLYSPLAPTDYSQSALSTFGVNLGALAIGAGFVWIMWAIYRDDQEPA